MLTKKCKFFFAFFLLQIFASSWRKAVLDPSFGKLGNRSLSPRPKFQIISEHNNFLFACSTCLAGEEALEQILNAFKNFQCQEILAGPASRKWPPCLQFLDSELNQYWGDGEWNERKGMVMVGVGDGDQRNEHLFCGKVESIVI